MTLRAHHWVFACMLAFGLHIAMAFALFYSSAPNEGARDKGTHGLEVSIKMVAAAMGAEAQEEIIQEPKLEPEQKVEEPKEPEPIEKEAVETIVQPKPKKVVEQVRKPLIKPSPPQTKPEPNPKQVKKQTEPARQKTVAVDSTGTAKQAPKANRTDKRTQSGGGQIIGQIIPSYKTTLGRWLAQYKTYPKKARRRNQEGVVHLSFTLNAKGYVTSYKIIKSAGHESLDEETIKMLERAQPLPKFPPEITDEHLTLTVPIQFALR
ncbi:MAG: energy transducer TonB [Methylocystaceae bacterium]|nr:energy transducer TonB [Methylocystaceae bacterium]